MSNSFIFYGLQILAELVWDILYFPVWWYGRGLVSLLLGLKNLLSDKQKSLALFIWIKNIFRPMYAQYDWQGWLISFFMRLAQIIFRSMILLVWLGLCLAAALGNPSFMRTRRATGSWRRRPIRRRP